jgi:hypothetical protein
LSLIEDEETARRLARAIMSDVTLYNGDTIAHAMDPERDLATEIEQARQLFQKRVAPRFYMVFEDGVRTWAADARARATPAVVAHRERVRDPVVASQERRNTETLEAAKRSRTVMLLTIVLLIAVAGAAFAFVSHARHDEAPGKHEGRR